MIKDLLLLILVLILMGIACRAQEKESGSKEKFAPVHSLSLTIGHEHSFSGRDEEGNREVLILPFWGLDYNFQFAKKFIIGLHTDFIIESYKVEKNLQEGETEVVERTRPVAPAVMGFYKANHSWSFGLGIGGEFAKEENYLLNRLAVEYGAEISNGWEVFGSLQYDFRWNAYDTFTIGLGIAREFGRRNKNIETKN